jgi:hypothetical protein
MTPLAGQVHSCQKCARRLPIDNVRGEAVVICPRCRATTVVRVLAAVTREQC